MRTLICCSFLLLIGQLLMAQNILTVGVGTTSSSLQSLIEEEGFEIKAVQYREVHEKSLADKEIVALFNLRQTWDKQPIFSQDQTTDLIDFVASGGLLYLTSRKSYSNLLVQLGVVLTGNDGGPTGRDWPLIMEEITKFEAHPITEGLGAIQTDVSAKFVVDKNWKVLAKTKDGTPMLAIRQLGAGQIILGSGERIFRDPRSTNNRYETDITQADNYQYHLNLFRYLKDPVIEEKADDQTKAKEVFQIFPNPTTQKVTIMGKEIIAIDLINVQGQILRQHKFPKENQIQMNFESMPAGLYFLKIQTTQGISVEEVMLQRN